jgi:hypothetical protein
MIAFGIFFPIPRTHFLLRFLPSLILGAGKKGGLSENGHIRNGHI